MQQGGYSDRSINRYNHCWNRLLQYQGDEQQIFSTEQALTFLQEAYNITSTSCLSKTDGCRVRAIQFLCEYNHYGRFSLGKISTGKVPGYHFKEYLDEFKTHQKVKHFISDATLYQYDRSIGKFLLFLTQQKLESMNQLQATHILDYCGSMASISIPSRHNDFSSLRTFLRFLHINQVLSEDYSTLIPSVPNTRSCKIPVYYTTTEQEMLLSAIDRASPMGKRDYAIALIAIRLGLRSSDIRLLVLSSLKWERNTLEIEMKKTKDFIVLPLLNDVGEAIIDYLQHGRPKSSLPYVFITHTTPCKELSASGVTGVIKRYSIKAGIECSAYGKGGPHALRSTLATHLLEHEVPLPVISEILGHKQTKTTENYYLKIDIPHLRFCCLEVSAYDWNRNDKEEF